jgi:hypothetical protein
MGRIAPELMRQVGRFLSCLAPSFSTMILGGHL